MNKERLISKIRNTILIILIGWVLTAHIYNYIMDREQYSRIEMAKQQLQSVETFKEYDPSEIEIRGSRRIIDRPVGIYIKSNMEKKEFMKIITKQMLKEGWNLEEESKEVGYLIFKKDNYIICMSVIKNGDWTVVIYKDDFFHKMSL